MPKKRSLVLPTRYVLPAFVLCVLSAGLVRAQSGKTHSASLVTMDPPVVVQVDGQRLAVHSTEPTVAGALKAAGVELAAKDECSPKVTEPVKPGETIVVQRVSTATYTRLETMPARTRVKPTGQLRHGLAMIAQHPSKGLKEVTYSVTRRDGEVVRRRVVDTRVIRRPKDKVILVGGREARLPSRGGYFSGRRVLNMVASGYPVWVCGTGRTYLGQRARRGIVAVDPRVIPLGARLFVEGYGEAVAGDIGGAIKGNRIDLCFETKREADRYGMQRIRVWILSE